MTRAWAAFASQTVRSIVVLLAAFVIKAVLIFAVLPIVGQFGSSRYSMGFVDLYDQIANNLVQGIGYRVEPSMSETMIREPGYPFFLASVFRISGYHIEAARLANLLLVCGIAWMMMRLTQRVTDDRATMLIATLLFIFHPGTLISEARGGVEVAFIFVVMLLMLALHRAMERDTFTSYFVAGAGLGAAVLVRSTLLFFPAFLLVYLVLTANGSRKRLKLTLNVAVLTFGMVVVLLPWMIRNYTLVHELVPTATVLGISAQEGQYTCQRLSSGRDFSVLQTEAGQKRNELASRLGVPFKGYYYQLFYTAQDEVAFNKSLLQEVARQYRETPTLLARCVGQNLVNFWLLGKTHQTTWLNAVLEVPLLVLALGGVYVLGKRGRLQRMGIMLMFVSYVVAVHAPIIAHARYSIPVLPFLMIPVSVSLVSIWRANRAQAVGIEHRESTGYRTDAQTGRSDVAIHNGACSSLRVPSP